MAPRHVGQDLQCRQLATGLKRTEPLLAGRALVPQLDDVHPAGEGRIGELGQVAALASGVGAQVKPGPRKSGASKSGSRWVHTATVAASVGQ